MTKLKACPFCGHRAGIETNEEEVGITEDELEFMAVCTWCSGNSGWYLDEAGAVEAWNTRADAN